MSATKSGPKVTPGLSPTKAGPKPEKVAGLAPLEPGPAAETLLRVWQGHPNVIVNSPPGSGKSTLVGTVVSHLATRSDLQITVATPTRAQAIATLWKLSNLIDPNLIHFAVSRVDPMKLPKQWMKRSNKSKAVDPKVTITTVAALGFRSHERTDLLIIDEAYQVTKAQMAKAASGAVQLLCVGDPGQIGPVITVDTSLFRGAVRPHARAPETLERREDALVVEMPYTYRLGPVTTAAIAPLYGFGFRSARCERSIAGYGELEAVKINKPDAPYSRSAMSVVVDRVEDLIGRDVTTTDSDGETTSKQLDPNDVAVVVTHNTQVSSVKSLLVNRGLSAVVVGTSDRLQGGEWDAVVAVDPFVGYEPGSVGAHSLSLGRLCVMASRHRAHLTFVHDGGWEEILADKDMGLLSTDDRDAAVRVRRSLCGMG